MKKRAEIQLFLYLRKMCIRDRLKGLSYDLIQVKRGKMSGADAIDHISAGDVYKRQE